MSRPHAMFAMESDRLRADLFETSTMDGLRKIVTLAPATFTDDMTGPPPGAAVTEILITSWGAPRFDEDMLEHWPSLRAIVHAAGSVKRVVTPAVWERGIRVSSSASANAVPVAEYTLSMILLSAKDALHSAREMVRTQSMAASRPTSDAGAFDITVGVIGASRIGRRLIELLRPFDVECLVYDPSLDHHTAALLGARLVTLPELLGRARVVSVHAPALPETRGMIGQAELAAMRNGATLINTARGSLVDTDALVAEIASGRLRAVLDVTEPEPLPPGHPLFALPGVTLTPHIAGSVGNELRRIGRHVLAEVERFVVSGEFADEVTSPDLARIA